MSAHVLHGFLRKSFLGIVLVFLFLMLSTCGSFSEKKSRKEFIGAELTTVESYLYGRFVVRMRAAKADGVISNFFTFKNDGQLQGVTWQEIDVEVFGKNGAERWQSNIIVDLEKRNRAEVVHTSPLLGSSFNTYSIEWTPDYVKWSFNGKTVRKVTSKLVGGLTEPASFRFNIWLPDSPEWVGSLNDKVLPVEMYVNWMEYHRWTEGTFELVWRDEFDFLNSERWRGLNHTFERNLAQFSDMNVGVYNGYLILSVTQYPEIGFHGMPSANFDSSGIN